MRNTSRGHAVAGVFVFFLLGLFAVLSALLILFGAQAYQHTLEESSQHNTQRVLYHYLRNAVRSADSEEAVRIHEEDGMTVLSINETEDFIRSVYLYDNQLMETFTESADDFDPEDGESICELTAFGATLDGTMLTVTLTDTEGTVSTLHIALYSGTGGDADE